MISLREQLQQNLDSWAVLGHDSLLEGFVLEAANVERSGASRGSNLGDSFREPKMCFYNAGRTVLLSAASPGSSSIDYCEGFAWRDSVGFPVHHAWLWDRGNDELIDTTFTDPEECSYLGIAFSTSELSHEVVAAGVWGLLDTGMGINADMICRRFPETKAAKMMRARGMA